MIASVAYRLPGSWDADSSRLSRTLVLFCAVLIAGICVALAWELKADRERTISRVMAANVNLARAFEEHVLGTIRGVDEHTKFIKSAYERSRGTMDLALYAQQRPIDPQLVTILGIIDENGRLAQASTGFVPIDLRDREFFKHHAQADTGQLYISKPLVGRITGKWSIYLSRRLNKPDGSFGGVAVAALDPRYLSDFFRQIDLGPNGVLTLVGLDGIVRARQSGDDVSSGQNLASSRLLTELLPRMKAGEYVDTSTIDKVTRVFAYRAVREYPLALVVGTSERTALAPFWARTTVHVAIAAASVIAILLGTALLLSQMKRQQRATRQLALSEARSRAIYDQAAVGIGEAAADGRWMGMNARLGHIFGYAGDQWRGCTVWDHIHPQDREPGYEDMRRLLAGEAEGISVERRYVRRDGTTFWVNLATSLVRADNASPEYTIGVVEDITARKNSELEAQALRNELEDRVAQRTTELSDANKRLESFSYSVSHDLRTPLRAISGFAQILARRHRQSLSDEGRHYMDNIVRASAQMGRLIEDLLSYSRLGRARMNLEPMPLRPLIAQVVEQLESPARAAGARIELAEAIPAVRGDTSLLTQIFLNLLDNALTYRRPDVAPVIVIRARLEGTRVVVSVADNGIGIPAEHFERIFGVFQRLHTQDQYPGTGIGLANVKKAVEILGGAVSVSSTPGQGSTFEVRLLHAANDEAA
jgi:PAS domain S-box-containing protein